MNDIFPTPNENEIFLYISQEIKNNKPLDEFEFGVGETKNPTNRYKEHNNTSSKITVKINFIAIYLMPKFIHDTKSETFIHNKLIALRYNRNQEKKEMFFSNTNDKIPLSLQIIQKEMEKYFIKGPWEIINKQTKLLTPHEDNQIEKYTLQIKNNQDVLKCIQYLENNKHEQSKIKKIFQQLHISYKKNLDIQLWAYNNNLLNYNGINKKIKSHYKIILQELQKNNLNTIDIINFEEIHDYENILSKEQAKIIVLEYIKKNNTNTKQRRYTRYKDIYSLL